MLLAFTVTGRCGPGEASVGEAWGQIRTTGQEVGQSEPAISQEEAMGIARKLFPELLAGKDLNIELAEDYRGGGAVWQINFDRTRGYAGGQVEYLSVSIDAVTGALKGMYHSGWSSGLEQDALPITKEAAKEKAEEYAKKFCPAEFAAARPVEWDYYYNPTGLMNNQYGFYWMRYENGIPVLEDGINIGVDVFSGRLVSFMVNWRDGVVFPQPGTFPEGLERKTLQELGLVLCYQVPLANYTRAPAVPEATLVYQLNSSGTLRIDPDSGGAVKQGGETLPLEQARRFSDLPAPAGGDGPEEPGPVSSPARKISQSKAREAAQDFFRKIGLEGEVSQSGGGSSVGGAFYDESWSYSLKDDGGKMTGTQRRHQSVGIDVFTGEVTSYHNFGEYDRFGPGAGSDQGLDRDAAREKAMEFIRLVAPEKLGQVVEEGQDVDYFKYGGGHYFKFARLVDGIPFPTDGITVGVDGEGEVTDYSCNWHVVRFPSAAGVISSEEAEKIFLAENVLEPVYFFPLEGEEPRPGKKPALTLMFDPYRDWGIDARTGEPVMVNQMVPRPEEKADLKISPEHWAAAALSILADSGLLPAGDFDPDGPVTRREAIRVLMSASGRGYDMYQQGLEKNDYVDITPDDPDYRLIQNAVRRGVLTGGGRFEPEQPFLREDLAIWLVRALGYAEIAEMPVEIELKTADAGQVSERARNYAAIACGLGLLKGDENGLLRPSEQVTWAELAALVTKAAPRLQSIPW